MEAGLVFDLGINNGDDTAYYLHRGYRVVGVDADPAMVAMCHERFAQEIAQGRLTLLNVAIAPQAGTTTFYVSQGNRGAWSSLDPHEASRGKLAITATTVVTRTLDSVLAEYGVPFYLKIDLEGGSSACLDDLRPGATPRYLSFEAQRGRLADLFTAARLGYTRFKLIDQIYGGFRQAVPPPLHSAALLADTARHLARRVLRGLPGVPRLVRRVRRALRGPEGRVTADDWVCPPSSSGPMAEETDGPWRSVEEVAYAWLYYAGKMETFWYDVHCTHD